MLDSDRHIAVHEAGHAVIGRILGMSCGPCTIRANHDASGHSVTGDPYYISGNWEDCGKFRDMASVWRGRIMTFQAGAEAEIEILGSCPGGDGDDRYQVDLMADQWASTNDRILALRRHTRRLIRRHRAGIERVAGELILRQRLGARQIDALVWPLDVTTRDFVTFRQLQPRFGIRATLTNVKLAMRTENFPRGYYFNGKVMWRIRDIESIVATLRR